MPGVRAFTEDDLEAAATVYEQAARSGSSRPPAGLAPAMRRLFLEAPYDTAECPALVHEDADGRVDAFMGVLLRRMRLGNESLRFGVAGPMVVAPATTSKAVGVLLDRHLMKAGYDAVLTDGASRDARNVWSRLGGQSTPLGSIHWTIALRPVTNAVQSLVERGHLVGVLSAARAPARAIDALLRRRATQASLPSQAGQFTSEPLDCDALIAGLTELGPRLKLRPDYDQATLTWLFRELSAVTSRGELRATLLRDGHGRLIGWYLYYLRRGGRSHVLQIASRPGGMGAVLSALLTDADRQGAVSVEGRAEADLLEALEDHPATYRHGTPFALLQTRRGDLLEALYAGRSLLTRLEGEWWVGMHLESYHTA